MQTGLYLKKNSCKLVGRNHGEPHRLVLRLPTSASAPTLGKLQAAPPPRRHADAAHGITTLYNNVGCKKLAPLISIIPSK
jgi:hypothetical protein